MSSITTAIPTGAISEWCIAPLEYYGGDRYQCANSTKGTKETDFQTFCCNGNIINSAHDIWRPASWDGDDHSVNLADMVCCGINGPQAGGILPLPSAYTVCDEGSPTALASVAATNTDNAALFPVTYTSASFGSSTTGDFVPTDTPTCFWAYTSGVGTKEVTLPAPDITTPPAPTTDAFGDPIPTPSTARPTSTSAAKSGGSDSGTSSSAPQTTVLVGTASQSSSVSSSSSTTTTSGVSSIRDTIRKGYLYVGLGLVAMSLLWS
ncbi:hypothetical protein F4804DRAFT_62370 [Jackrogersella minutella]|nr:hypothetical protein F4804DRAFT_62370 [Jackrogersella minutella]